MSDFDLYSIAARQVIRAVMGPHRSRRVRGSLWKWQADCPDCGASYSAPTRAALREALRQHRRTHEGVVEEVVE